jgi:uncharacterized repeat protein (TIGR03803 family)
MTVSLAVLLGSIRSSAAQTFTNFTKLHDFSYNNLPGTVDGVGPSSPLTAAADGLLYGTTGGGGDYDRGTVFSVNEHGVETVVYSFTFGDGFTNLDGMNPQGRLVVSGGRIYGIAGFGGTDASGTVFSMATNGEDFRTLHTFKNDGFDARLPRGGLVLLDGTLFGPAASGGSDPDHTFGAIYSIGTNGDGYTVRYSFPPNGNFGAYPLGNLVVATNILTGQVQLYGTTSDLDGSVSGQGSGTIFVLSPPYLQTDSVTFHVFPPDDDTNWEGAHPAAALLCSSNILYGLTSNNGSGGTGNGTLFSVDVYGQNFTVLRRFTNSDPSGELLLGVRKLFGTVVSGGHDGVGAVFSFNLDTNSSPYEFKYEHSFPTSGEEGFFPLAGVTSAFGGICGTAISGGNFSFGTVFFLTNGVRLPIDSGLKLVAGGGTHSLGIKPDGSVRAWGNDQYGQIGDGASGSGVKRLSPVTVPNVSAVVSVSAGFYHSMALRFDGLLWTWGRNDYGQLGLGISGGLKTTPNAVNSLSGIVGIAAGGFSSFAVRNDGTAWAWGRNSFGNLGDGTTVSTRTAPVQITALSNVVAVAGGRFHAMALESNGSVWVWGNNSYGQLGNGTTSLNQYVPVQVGSISNIVAISAGAGACYALESNGALWAWGHNDYGELGDGTFTQRLSPVRVTPFDNGRVVTRIAADGAFHCLAIADDDSTWTWGWGSSGQLGNGFTTNSATPIAISLFSQTAIAVGGDGVSEHTLGLGADNVLRAWGASNYGQVGDGSTTNHPTPVSITGF